MNVSSDSSSTSSIDEMTMLPSTMTENDVAPKPIELCPPSRPDVGKAGRPIALRANYFSLSFPTVTVHHYKVDIEPMSAKTKNREILNVLFTTFRLYFNGALPVYDGRCNLYTRKLVPIGEAPMQFDIQIPSDRRPFKVTISYNGPVDCGRFEKDVEEKKAFISPEAVYATDVILRHLSSLKYTTIGRSFFHQTGDLGESMTGNCDLGNGRELWFGYHQSLKPTEWKMMLNIDLSNTAFYRPQNVVNFLADFLELPVEAFAEKTPLPDSQRIRFGREVKGLRVEVTHSGTLKRKYRICHVTRRSAAQQTFILNRDDDPQMRKEITVAEYFADKYNIRLKYAHLPCLQVGEESRGTYLPLEVCRISNGQRCQKRLTDYQTSVMIRGSHRSAPEREEHISNLLSNIGIATDPFISDYGISIDTKLTEVPGRVLEPPKLLYARNADRQYQTVIPNSGTWDLRGRQFHSGIKVHTWALVSFSSQIQVKEQDLRNFTKELRKVSSDAGMPIQQQPVFCKYASGAEQVEPMFRYIKSTFPEIQIVVAVLPGKSCVYAEIKKVGDTVLGIPTQCISQKNLLKVNVQTLSNICLKMNVKMGGVNSIVVPHCRPKLFEEPVIFLGAAVLPPLPGELRKPILTSVVGSVDAHPSRYAATVRVQTSGDVIREMSSMVRDLLVKFRRNTGFRPMRIVMYRSGVSDGQYYNILQYELRAIREACQLLEKDYNPGITFIIVQKRHHSRLFAANPADYRGRADNIPAGTIVDQGITHPSQFDFYLCSHAGIQGTSRPSRYHIMWDDNRMTSDEVQKLTFQLCHTYARCTRSVSIPTPAFYAHLVVHRARYHLFERTNVTEGSYVESMYSAQSRDGSEMLTAMAKNIRIHPDASDFMYYA